MEVENTPINGLKLIHLKNLVDARGSFIKTYNNGFFKQHNLNFTLRESYFSISAKNVIRGMHFQAPPAEHIKLVYLNNGAVLDVVLDIRKESQTYGQFFTTIISSNNPVLLYIPVGCAHGFLSLQNNTIVSYLQTSSYHREYDKGVRYNSFGMHWGINNPILSTRDQSFPELKNFNSPFKYL